MTEMSNKTYLMKGKIFSRRKGTEKWGGEKVMDRTMEEEDK